MVFIRNRNEKLFRDIVKGELLYLRRQDYRNSPPTVTLHLEELHITQS